MTMYLIVTLMSIFVTLLLLITLTYKNEMSSHFFYNIFKYIEPINKHCSAKGAILIQLRFHSKKIATSTYFDYPVVRINVAH
jgi:hypothetical protein